MAAQVSDAFREAIKTYLDGAAAFDEAFAEKYSAEGKSLDECCDYIVTQVQKSGRHGFADAEIYGLAMHYYQEAELGKITKRAASCSVVVNHTIELTEEEKEQARQKAINDLAEAEKRKIADKERREKEAAKRRAEEAAKKAAEEGALFLF